MAEAFSILERIVVCATMLLPTWTPTATVTFSILERIVVCATSFDGRNEGGVHHLSVSSNGSWCVQLTGPAPAVRAPISFSILERIVVCATTMNQQELTAFYIAFSILERIVVCATAGCCGAGLARVGFQYPRTDRGVCNGGLG